MLTRTLQEFDMCLVTYQINCSIRHDGDYLLVFDKKSKHGLQSKQNSILKFRSQLF